MNDPVRSFVYNRIAKLVTENMTSKLFCAIAILICATCLPSANASTLYLIGGSTAYQVDLEAGTFETFNVFDSAYGIAVGETVRLRSYQTGYSEEYNLDGTPTGNTYTYEDGISQILDGTTDGTYNYGAGCCGADGVYRFDTNWGNAEFLFDVGSGTSGIAYDPVNNSLWVTTFGPNVYEYDLSGNLLSSITVSETSFLVALAYDPATDSFWANQQSDSFYNFDRDGTVLQVVTIDGLNPGNVFGGEFAMGSPIPEPSSAVLILLGIAGTYLARRRGKKRHQNATR